jgi:hypothetical protein
LVKLLWVYFALLIVEGALRKWMLPGWSDQLLIVRDPVAAVIIYFAFRDGYLTISGPMRGLAVLFAGFVLLAILQLGLGYMRSVSVVAFGLRTYFLHPPVIFVMAAVMDSRAIRRLTLATLIAAVPIALLMVLQFEAGPKDWINVGAGLQGWQIPAALGKIRPAGPFSYVSGPVWYFSLTFACLVAAHVNRDRMPRVIRWAAWMAVLVAVAVSGSRSLVVALIPVIVCVIAALSIQPRLFAGVVRAAATLVIAAVVVWSFSVVQSGLHVLDVRMQTAGGTQEMIQRSSTAYLMAQTAWTDAPLVGAGLGLGTNAGAALLGRSAFQLGEEEWSRVIYEAGPVLGLAYLLWRVWIALMMLRTSARAASTGSVMALALLGACASNVVLGQWGQPGTQGFAVWVAGLCLAAGRAAEPAPRSV